MVSILLKIYVSKPMYLPRTIKLTKTAKKRNVDMTIGPKSWSRFANETCDVD